MTIETKNSLAKDVGVEQASEMLRISLHTLLKKLGAGEIAFHYAASERRIAVADLLDRQRRQRELAQASLKQMRDEADEMGLYA